MQPILYFDVCSLPIFAVMLITVFLRRMTKGISNRLFIAILVLSSIAAFSDVAAEYACRSLPLTDLRLFLANLFSIIYFITRNISIALYFLFMFAITGTWYRVRPRSIKTLLMLPYAGIVILMLINPFTGLVFTIDPLTGYHRGPAIYVLYAVSVLYAFVGTVYLFSCRRFLTGGKISALVLLYLLSMAAVAVQYFFPFLLLEMISAAFAMVFVVLFVLRPEETTDASVGSLSFQAYRVELRKVLMTRQKVQIAAICFLNANELRSYLGEEHYLSYAAHVIGQLDIMFLREHIFFDIYFEQPGTVYIKVDDPDFDVADAYRRLVGELRSRSDKTASSGERIIAKACNIVIPDDLCDFDEIIRFGREFSTMMPTDVVYSDAADIISSRNYKLISSMDVILNRAIAENRFRMYYQPIYSVEEKKFVSAEALIRLIDDEFGIVSPALFIPAAEKRGVIQPIGDFVLADVHRFISENDFEALGLRYIEVNLSVAQCMQEELPEKLAFFADKYGVSPDMINLEITETTYEEIGRVMEFNLEALSGIGYTFSLDDYGTGYSNMHRVSKLPLKIIKLDKSLIDDMCTDEGLSIVRNTIKMMRDIGKELVAEGVETAESFEQLESMGCQFIQGYYFSKPLPAKEFVEFLKKHNNNA